MRSMEAYPRAAMERAMKVQDVMLQAMAKKITWWQAAEILGISDRHMRRWRERYVEEGYNGLAFLVPGVVSPDLPPAFAHSAAYGDIIAAILALLAMISLPSASGFVVAWIFSFWGTADLFNAFYQANHAGLMAGQLGATYFIPTFIVPILLITHGLGFRILLRHQNVSAVQQSRRLA